MKKSTKGKVKQRPDVKVFIAEYKIDRNGRRAAIAAGYSPASADQTASRLIRTAKVREEIEAHRAEVIAKVKEETGLTLERVLGQIARGVFFDARKLLDPDGSPKPIGELDDDTAMAVAGLDVQELRLGGEDSDGRATVKKYKLADRSKYIDMAMKHLGGYEVDNRQKTDPLAEAVKSMGADEIARRIAFTLALGLQAKDSAK
jgi:phage terminase small subunit